MSAIEDVTEGIAAIVAALEETATAAAGAVTAAEEGATAIAVVGIESDIEAWNSLKDQLEGIVTQVAGVAESVEEAQNQANAMAGGT